MDGTCRVFQIIGTIKTYSLWEWMFKHKTTMAGIYESLKAYFENTPKEQLNKDWEEIKHLNEIGPDVLEYAELVKGNS